MARIDNLKNYLIDVGKAIKKKKRDYRKINARDYDKFISELSRSPHCLRDSWINPRSRINTKKPDFSQTDETTNNVLYQDYDNFGKTYYYRGNVTNNYVLFADYYWRIIRINGNGSLRLFFVGSTPNGSEGNIEGAFHSPYHRNLSGEIPEYAGLKYEEGKRHGTKVASTILGEDEAPAENTLNWWYEQNIINKGLEEFIDKESGFICDRTCSSDPTEPYDQCDDDGETGINKNVTYFGFFRRSHINNNLHAPTFKFMNYKDYFTTADSPYGNHCLKYPIGLITADEVCFAGAVRGQRNTGFYLYNAVDGDEDIKNEIWTSTPYDYNGAEWTQYNACYVITMKNGNLQRRNIQYEDVKVNPVINIKPNVRITSGYGTSTSPYRLQLPEINKIG